MCMLKSLGLAAGLPLLLAMMNDADLANLLGRLKLLRVPKAVFTILSKSLVVEPGSNATRAPVPRCLC